MVTHIITRKGSKLLLDGNKLGGDTFAEKDYIKNKLGGKWDKMSKTWEVDVAQVERWLNTVGAHIRIDTDAAPTQAQPKLMSYADFLRNADNPNSDY